MLFSLAERYWQTTDARILRKFVFTFAVKGACSVLRFRHRLRRGRVFPAFLMLSLTDRCNLRCQGCWVSPCSPPRDLPRETLEALVAAGRRHGSSFFGLLGGEPLLYPGLFPFLESHPECYFQLFTNGTLLTRDTAARLRALGNVTPLISIEGNEVVSDRRRGGERVYGRSMAALDACREERLLFGVATSLCRTNIDDLLTEEFLNELVRRGAHYMWYYIYRPVGPQPCPELALTAEEIRRVREFLVDVRSRVPILVVDAYWDQDGRPLCPGAVGLSHHVGPGGDLEFCPPLQVSCGRLTGTASTVEKQIADSLPLQRLRSFVAARTHGCILLEAPDELAAHIASDPELCDSSGRDAFLSELERMQACACHDMGTERIPERHWFYRLAKRYAFFGFGAYG